LSVTQEGTPTHTADAISTEASHPAFMDLRFRD